jgi:glucose/arabinose dehydrogenase
MWLGPALAAGAAALLAGCGGTGPDAPPTGPNHQATVAARTSPALTTISPLTDATTTPALTTISRLTASARSLPARSTTSLAGHSITVPAGWHAERWAAVPGARLETWTPSGALLVSEPGNGRIAELTPVPGHPGQRPHVTTVVSGLSEPQGMAFDRVGGREVLFVAEDDEIDRYTWRGNGVGSRTVIVRDLPDTAPEGSDNHTLKNIVVGADGRIYVDIGSGSNAGPLLASTPPRASVVSYSTSGTEYRLYATGVRNGDGLSVAPDGSLWTAVNGRDQIAYPYRRTYGGSSDAYGQVIETYVTDHPSDQVAKLTPGRNLGWPYCDADPDVTPGSTTTAFRYTDEPFVRDQQTNAGGAALDCAALPRLQVGLPAHSAPLGLHFLTASRLPRPWRNGAALAVHGSWDATPPRPPAVLWMPWNRRTHTLGAARTLIGGFQSVDGSRWGRPVDAVPGPDGSLYVSDDQAGEIYRFTP